MVKTPAFANIIKATGIFLASIYILYGRNPVGSTSARAYGGYGALAVSRSPEGGLIRRDKEAWETQQEFEGWICLGDGAYGQVWWNEIAKGRGRERRALLFP